MKPIATILLLAFIFAGCEKDEKRDYRVTVNRNTNEQVKVIIDGVSTEFFNDNKPSYSKDFSFLQGRLIQIDASYTTTTGTGLTMKLYRGSDLLETKTGDRSVSIKFTDQ